MSQSTLISIEQLGPVLSAFGLTATGSPRVLKDDPQSTVVQLDAVVLKGQTVTQPADSSRLQSLALTAKVQNLLQQKCPEIVPKRLATADTGAYYWLSPTDNRLWSSCQFIAGTSFDWLTNAPAWKPAHARSAGELLAKVHCAGATIQKQLDRVEREDLRSVLPSLTNCAQVLRENTEETFLDAGLISLLSDTITQSLNAITSGAEAATLTAEETIVHGDFHPGNVVFDGEKALAAVDFDYAQREHPLYDLAYAWLMFSADSKTDQSAAGLLSGYKQHYESIGKPLPKYIPDDESQFRNPPAQTPLRHYSVVAAYLLLLWTFSAEGSAHHLAGSLAIRMVERIQRLAKQ